MRLRRDPLSLSLLAPTNFLVLCYAPAEEQLSLIGTDHFPCFFMIFACAESDSISFSSIIIFLLFYEMRLRRDPLSLALLAPTNFLVLCAPAEEQLSLIGTDHFPRFL
jgi:hypothetical protein